MIEEMDQLRKPGGLAALVVLKTLGEVLAVWAARIKLT